MAELSKCPCGQVPEQLAITEGSTCKYSWVAGHCCSEWNIEFRTDYQSGDALMALAVAAWNAAPRVDAPT